MEDDSKLNPSPKKGEMPSRERQANVKQVIEEAFNPQDPQQQFYRQNQPMEAPGELLTRLGWRVADLLHHQEDLALQCFALLSSELIFPITTVSHLLERRVEGREEEARSLWMEVSFLTSHASKDFLTLGNKTPEGKIFHFCQQQLLPLLKAFITKYLSWGAVTAESHRDSAALVELFRKEVVERANVWIEEGNFFSKAKLE